jgi:trans-aconitate methyltransferase
MVGSVETLSADIGLFDKIYSVNVVQFWKTPVSTFKRLRNFLKPGGSILTVYMPRHLGSTDADAFAKGKQIEDWLGEAGFSHIRTESKVMKPVAAIAVSATVDTV